MKVFLEGVIPSAEPWVSSQDTPAGGAWFHELTSALIRSQFGLLCLSKGTESAPWIAFEAGALAVQLGSDRICPYLLDVDIVHLRKLGLPYHLANAVNSSRDGTAKLVSSVFRCLPEREQLEERRVKANIRANWPRLRKAIAEAKKGHEPPSKDEQVFLELTLQNKTLQDQQKLTNAKINSMNSLLKRLLKSPISQINQSSTKKTLRQ